MRFLWGCLLAGVLACAAPPPPLACTKDTRGQFWPQEANANRRAAVHAMRSNEVYLCGFTHRHYVWEPFSVNWDTLDAAGAHPKPNPDPKPAPKPDAPTEQASAQ